MLVSFTAPSLFVLFYLAFEIANSFSPFFYIANEIAFQSPCFSLAIEIAFQSFQKHQTSFPALVHHWRIYCSHRC